MKSPLLSLKAAAALFAACAVFAQPIKKEPPKTQDEKMQWFREAKFGLFIHWGLYSIPAGEWKGRRSLGLGEWIMFRTPVPVKEYEPLAKQFNPVKFNADEWVKLARARMFFAPRAAGCR